MLKLPGYIVYHNLIANQRISEGLMFHCTIIYQELRTCIVYFMLSQFEQDMQVHAFYIAVSLSRVRLEIKILL